MSFPLTRLRRNRRDGNIRRMVRETRLTPENLVMPMFVRHGKGIKNEIPSMPGQFQFSPDTLAEEARALEQAGVPAIILFGIPNLKDDAGSESFDEEGIIPRAIDAVKRRVPDLCVITDVCMCEYTDHGHCGVVKERRDGILDVDNDATLDLLVRQAIAHVNAGADVVAPSDMMDGRVGAIRRALDEARMTDVPILAYSAKYASSFYGPFRDAAESTPQFGDRSTYQMDPANAREAMREIELDIEEGADMVMIKPALPYLDIIRMARDRFDVPLAAYNVSGEYAMVKAAAQNGWISEQRAAMETLLAIRRAGADFILTYWAKEAAGWL